MKICHIATGFPISFNGGITNYVRALAEYQKKNNEVWVVSGEDSKENSFNVFVYKSKNIKPFSLVSYKDSNALRNLKDFLDEHKFDLIHIHMTLGVDWNLYQIVKPYKYIISLHDYYFICPRIAMMQPGRHLCRKYNKDKCANCISRFGENISVIRKMINATELLISKIFHNNNMLVPKIKNKEVDIRHEKYVELLRGADVLLPVSNRVKEIFINSQIPGNYEVLHIGNISADDFDKNYKFDDSKQKINIVVLSAVSYEKGGHILYEFAKKLNRNIFDIHFYGRASKINSIRMKKYGIINHGKYKQVDLKNILSKMDLGFVFSVWEDNGPQTVMEMLNNHVPVIGTKMGGIPDFINEENGMLFDPYNKTEVINAIQFLNNITNDDIKRMKKAIKPTMSMKEHIFKLDNIYKLVSASDYGGVGHQK